jgi:hypothetical protein
MTDGLGLLLATAVGLGVTHTLLGPDHYIPFIAMARAGGWSAGKTALVTALSGVGHVLASLVLGTVGIALGISVDRLGWIESRRGEAAGLLLLGFGLAYTAWGLWRALRGRPHHHRHEHPGAGPHDHRHSHGLDHAHLHQGRRPARLTPWVLFTLLVFGPCEVLIPLLMYPSALRSAGSVVLVAGVFGSATIATMLAVVLAARKGLALLRLPALERFSNAIAGGAIALCGVAVTVLGL